jgi:hypothetical protein
MEPPLSTEVTGSLICVGPRAIALESLKSVGYPSCGKGLFRNGSATVVHRLHRPAGDETASNAFRSQLGNSPTPRGGGRHTKSLRPFSAPFSLRLFILIAIQFLCRMTKIPMDGSFRLMFDHVAQRGVAALLRPGLAATAEVRRSEGVSMACLHPQRPGMGKPQNPLGTASAIH